MHTNINAMIYDRWTLHIDKVTSDFLREFGSLSLSELNWKYKPDSWSIAQNIDHLIVINDSYFPLVNGLRTGEYKPHFITKFKFVVDRAGQYLLDGVQPDPVKKFKTLPMWQPRKRVADQTLLEKFDQHQHSLTQLITDSYDLLDKNAVISSPANRLIVYRLSTAFDIILAHEKRHFQQAIDVLARLKNNMVAVRC